MKWNPVSQPPAQPDASIVYDSTSYLVTDGVRVGLCDFNRGNGAGKPWAEWSQYGCLGPGEIIAWMPLPKPPAM